MPVGVAEVTPGLLSTGVEALADSNGHSTRRHWIGCPSRQRQAPITTPHRGRAHIRHHAPNHAPNHAPSIEELRLALAAERSVTRGRTWGPEISGSSGVRMVLPRRCGQTITCPLGAVTFEAAPRGRSLRASPWQPAAVWRDLAELQGLVRSTDVGPDLDPD